jgi:hypothetical protein
MKRYWVFMGFLKWLLFGSRVRLYSFVLGYEWSWFNTMREVIFNLANNLKGRSSRLFSRDMPNIKERYWGKGSALWHRSYFSGSVGGAPLEIVKQYIQQQDTPH